MVTVDHDDDVPGFSRVDKDRSQQISAKELGEALSNGKLPVMLPILIASRVTKEHACISLMTN